jgi:hypothetical protein
MMMSEVSTLRLYLLRAMYAFMFVGLAMYKWPGIINPPPGLSTAASVVGSVLGAISLLALLGVVLVPLVVPWGYVFRQYVRAPGDPWRKQVTVSSPGQPASSPSQVWPVSGVERRRSMTYAPRG